MTTFTMMTISKNTMMILPFTCLILSACSQMPKECEESWNKIEKLAIESGIPKDAVQQQKQDFEKQIEALSKEQAIETCNAQSSILGMVK